MLAKVAEDRKSGTNGYATVNPRQSVYIII
nr:MAG TPA: Pre-mRNA-splicing factor-like protein [Caudoviricetes sp.]